VQSNHQIAVQSNQCQDRLPCNNESRKHFKPCCKHQLRMHAACRANDKKCRQASYWLLKPHQCWAPIRSVNQL